MDKPNLVFVLTDQMGSHSTAYNGDPNVKTPFLNKLADESLNFVNAVSNCPVCTPYRACLISGQYPLTHGMFMNDLSMPDNGHSLGQELKHAGYNTAWIGKWHLDGNGRKNYIPPERRQGFDYWKVLECTHEYNHSQYYDGNDDTPRFWEGYDVYAQTDDAVNYIADYSKKKAPFAVFLSFGPPHNPYNTAPEILKAGYPPESLKLRDNVSAHRHDIARNQLQGFYAHITAIDQCIDKLDTALSVAGIKENTIFIFTSDHGDMLESHWHGDSSSGSHKQGPYNESVMVPFLLRYPAKYGGGSRKVSEPLATPDIMPTLLEICGLHPPETVEGISLKPLLDDNIKPEREGVLIASYHPFAGWRVERGGRPYRGIRTERYTFVRDLNGPWMLFDNQADPYQMTNLVNKTGSAKIQNKLDNALNRILDGQNDAFEKPEQLRRRWNYTIDSFEQIPYR